MTLKVVRNLRSDTTHVQDVTSSTAALSFGVTYARPNAGRAVCGVHINDGVIMRPGTKVKCRPCKYISKIEEQQ